MSTIDYSSKGRIATLTINRPEYANAFATETYDEMANLLKQVGDDSSVGAVVITGAGRYFSAGGDVKRFQQLINEGSYLQKESVQHAGIMTKAIRECPKPVIAMINGAAAGAGLSCALACDFRVATPKTKFVMAFVNMGLCGDTGSIRMLTQIIGIDKAAKMMMSGDPVKGEQAHEWGLITILAEDEDKLAEETYTFAEKLASKPTGAHAAQKRILNKYIYDRFDEYLADEAAEMAQLSRHPDFTEAVDAFLNKRIPQFNKR